MSFIINPYRFAAAGGDVPSTITGLRLWLRGASLSALSADAQITTWPDESGNANEFDSEEVREAGRKGGQGSHKGSRVSNQNR